MDEDMSRSTLASSVGTLKAQVRDWARVKRERPFPYGLAAAFPAAYHSNKVREIDGAIYQVGYRKFLGCSCLDKKK